MSDEKKLVTVGAGRMGRGIATAFAYAGHNIVVADLRERTPHEADLMKQQVLAEVEANLSALAELGVMHIAKIPEILSRIRYTDSINSVVALREADIVFEGVPETLEAKIEIFEKLSLICRADAVIASTTSTMLSTELAKHVRNPERFLNAHWLNPAYLIPLVELSPHSGTCAESLEALKSLLVGIGKIPITCKASPGYIVPRLQGLIMNEAARMVEEGVATPEEIDKATRYGFGFRFASIGVVEFIDYGGAEILYHGARYLAQNIDRDRFATPDSVSAMVNAGNLGLKSGKGFYDYSNVDEKAYKKDVLARTLKMLNSFELFRPPV